MGGKIITNYTCDISKASALKKSNFENVKVAINNDWNNRIRRWSEFIILELSYNYKQ